MNILHISYIETNQGWGAECFVDRAFEELGHTVCKLDFKKHERHLTDALKKYEDFDVVLLQRGDHFPKGLLLSINRPKIFWASELISRCRDQDRLLYSKQFAHYFVHSEACKSTLCKKLSQKGDSATVSCLLNAFDEKLHRKLYLEKNIDVLFIGSITKRRKLLLDRLKRKNNITICSNIFGEDFVRKVNRAKIVINIHASKQLDTETRIFEVLGCGSFLLTEPLSEENPFISGQHYIEADIEDFTDQINRYLHDDEKRENIARQGYIEAISKHSYIQRTKNEIVPVLSDYIRDKSDRNLPIYDNRVLVKYKVKEESSIYWRLRKIYIRLFSYYQRLYDWINVK